MINNSTLTLADIKTQLQRHTQDNRINDLDIIDAVNDFYSIVQRLDRNMSPEKYKASSGAISITSSGYDLANLTNIGTFHGLKVFKGEQRVQDILPLRFKGSSQRGYYIEGSTLYLTPETDATATIYIDYFTKTYRVETDAVLEDETLQIDQDLERALRVYLKHSFYEGEYQFDLRDDAENKAMVELDRYFNDSSSPRGW